MYLVLKLSQMHKYLLFLCHKYSYHQIPIYIEVNYNQKPRRLIILYLQENDIKELINIIDWALMEGYGGLDKEVYGIE